MGEANIKRARGFGRCGGAWPKAALTAFLVVLLWQPPAAGAGGVRDVVRDLYGGDGITVAPEGRIAGPHFLASSLQGLDNLNRALTANVGLLAFTSPRTGFTFDVELGVPVPITESLGPLLAEHATTLGAKKLTIAFSYSRIEFKRFEGTPLDDLVLTFEHIDVDEDGMRTGIERDVIRVDLDLEIEQDVFALFATYGLTRIWDVGIVLPIVRAHARAEGNATIILNDVSEDVHQFDLTVDPPRSTVDREKIGIGDVVLRTKYNFLRKRPRWPDLAVVSRLKLASGDEDDLLGTGETNFLALLVASKSLAKVTPHLNLGYELTTESEQNNLRYLAGVDALVHPRLTLGFDVLGRWEPNGDGIGDHMADLALGGKWKVFGSFLLNAFVQLPLNRDEGLRPDVIWTVGGEMPF